MDQQYKNLTFKNSEIEHQYGKNIHILSDPYLLLGLSTLSSEKCVQPLLHYWIGRLYRSLLQNAVNVCFEKKNMQVPTRMKAFHPEANFEAALPDPDSKVVVVNLARAGIVPSFYCYDELNYFLNPLNVRQDHVMLSRTTDQNEKVTGSQVGATKIGGTIDNSYVLIPDPMGATGSTILSAMKTYEKHGHAKKWIAMHLIITPEYIRNIQKSPFPIEVFALRLDRGLSSQEALSATPGTHWDQERGLNDKQYIVPGAGGLGEILNNSWV